MKDNFISIKLMLMIITGLNIIHGDASYSQSSFIRGYVLIVKYRDHHPNECYQCFNPNPPIASSCNAY